MLEAIGLVKRYGKLTAVDGVSFKVNAGEAVGLLGPNGAGKSTTVALLTGLLRPDSGEVLYNGRRLQGDTDPLKQRLGLVPQELALVEDLTARANLQFFGALQGLGGRELDDAMERCLSLVELTDRANVPVRTFSGGMKRRLNLAVALLHDPQLVVLDEPSVGVDPQSRNAIFEGLEELKARGKSLLYTTHYMEEAERLCDRLVIIDHGKVVADGDLRTLSRMVPAANLLSIELTDPTPGPWLNRVREVAGVVSARAVETGVEIELTDLADSARVLDALKAGGRAVTHVASERADLLSIFLSLTGRSQRDS